MNPTTAPVTQWHIDNGKACEGAECPIALAVLEALAAQGVHTHSIHVAICRVTVDLAVIHGQRRFVADLDEHANDFIQALDECEEDRSEDDQAIIAPFELELTWREGTR